MKDSKNGLEYTLIRGSNNWFSIATTKTSEIGTYHIGDPEYG